MTFVDNCLYEVTIDKLICAFMHVANYKSWLSGGSIGKGLNLTCL